LNKKVNLTVQALQRMPYYLQYLRKAKEKGIEYASATVIANDLKLNDVLVRKDMAAICTTQGKPKSGFIVDELIKNIEEYLGYNNTMDAILVGVGSLGRALLGNREFEKFGLNIVAAFDIDESVIDHVISGKRVFPLERLKGLAERMHIHIGIIAVPGEFAQDISDRLVDSGIKAIWNFSLVKINVPDNVLVQNENLAASLAKLSLHLRDEMKNPQ
jgi:redox-sensing transcriptional repressor